VDWQQLNRLWQLRVRQRVPLQYLLGWAAWRDFRVQVTPDVLIPRPETELLVDLATDWINNHPAVERGLWVDLGTGSGAIAIGLARQLPELKVVGVDISQAALRVAAANVGQFQLSDRIQLLEGNWFTPLERRRGQIEGMIANPPYIPTTIISQLQPEVQAHEPQVALDGGERGLEDLERLIVTAPDYLRAGGLWLVEVMQGQAEWVAQRLQAVGSYRQITIHPDLSGVQRFVRAEMTPLQR
jgi:release factor glutamine methyltransferase